MQILAISESFSVTGQIDHHDFDDLVGLGFKTVINNRPDNEQAGQPLSKALEEAAKKAGVGYHHIPIIPGKATRDDVEMFRRALEASDGPVLAFCKSGIRAKSMFAASQPKSGMFSRLLAGKK